MHIWTEEQLNFLREQYPTHTQKELLAALNERFNLSITINQLIGTLKNHKIKCGRTGRFEKGRAGWNKGKKGLSKGGEKSWFKKGQVPVNYKPVGFERMDRDGYILVKVSDTGQWHERWQHKHKIVWREANGEIPAKHVIIFLDGDKTNCSIENLVCVSNAVNLEMNRNKLRFNEPSLMQTAIQLAETICKTKERLKEM